MTEVRRFAEPEALLDAAAEHVVAAAQEAIAERGRLLLVLAGGGTPRGAYERLAGPHAERIDWARVHLFWGDERCVPPEDDASNYGMAVDSLLRHVRVPDANVHRIRGEEGAARAAALYDGELGRVFSAASPADLAAEAAFDLVLLGIGEDGHTASIFPGSPALQAAGWAGAAEAPPGAPVRERVTLTLPAINAARECLFLATGPGKGEAVRRALQPSDDADPGETVPAALVRPRERTVWLLDSGAAARIG